MNEFRLLFQIFLIFVLFSGIYVIFWVHKYSESFTEGLTDTPSPSTTSAPSDSVNNAPVSSSTTPVSVNNQAPTILATPTSAPSTVLSTAYSGNNPAAPNYGSAQTPAPWPGAAGSVNANQGNNIVMSNNLMSQQQVLVPQYVQNNNVAKPGSAANAVPVGSTDSSVGAAQVKKSDNNNNDFEDKNRRSNHNLSDTDNSTDKDNSHDSRSANDSKTGEQNLDDYVLNQHPVTLHPSGNRENNVHEITDGNDFIQSTVAYPGSPYAPFDPLNEDINHYEYVAKEFASSQPSGLSDNPMDPNWGGVKFTQDVIKSGKYNDNNITKPLLFQPKGLYIDAVPSAFGKPQDKLD
jgi:hypothetical protein